MLPNADNVAGVPSGTFEIHRVKGRLVLTDGGVMHLQGVREIFELGDAGGRRTASGSGEGKTAPTASPTQGKIVVIGRGLDMKAWSKSLAVALA